MKHRAATLDTMKTAQEHSEHKDSKGSGQTGTSPMSIMWYYQAGPLALTSKGLHFLIIEVIFKGGRGVI